MTHSKEQSCKKTAYADVLEEDTPIAGQKFACISFISPEKHIKQRQIFMYEQFLKSWDYTKSTERFHQFLNFITYKYNLEFDTLVSDFKDFLNEEKDALYESTIEDDFKTFMDNNEDKLANEYSIMHDFQTSVRGLKVRGVFSTQPEAENRCKLLREADPNHDVFVGPVGLWMPWEPEAYKTGRVEYLEDELNQLMHNKNKNEQEAKEHFDLRIKEAKRKAIEDNVRKAQESGNKLTQTLTEDGKLINVAKLNSGTHIDDAVIPKQQVIATNNNEVSSADIRQELFESNNITTNLDIIAEEIDDENIILSTNNATTDTKDNTQES
jgi:hypothetical protein